MIGTILVRPPCGWHLEKGLSVKINKCRIVAGSTCIPFDAPAGWESVVGDGVAFREEWIRAGRFCVQIMRADGSWPVVTVGDDDEAE